MVTSARARPSDRRPPVVTADLRLPITATGAVTAVGLSAHASCAAVRAGVSRPRPLQHFRVLEQDSQELVPVTGHPVDGLTDGFNMVGCWLRLARACVEDCIASGALPAPTSRAFWERTLVIAALPYPAGPRFGSSGTEADLVDALVEPLCRQLGLETGVSSGSAVGLGHASVVEAVQRAAAALAAGSAERALVVAVDAMTDPLTLQWLAASGRLKTDENPTGVSPGEAAGCFLLETPPSAKRRGAPSICTVSSAARATEPIAEDPLGARSGRALADTIRGALEKVGGPAPHAAEVFADLNGETWRAQEWGMALVRLGSTLVIPRLHLAAASLGDTGAASAGVAVCHAIHLFRRGGLRGERALVVSSSEAGDVGCLMLQRSDR
jgi:3-oxoacyl-[acyl-carrier-protein] synthase I